MTNKSIEIKNAKVHNLKGIDVIIPKNCFVVVSGLSGSGKSSLAFDTLFAEGQRRYVESLSVYARQFIDRMEKPQVDYIKGISPAIAIGQKVASSNPRSTVGTATEIFEYIKLLYAGIGKTYSPISQEIVTKDSVEDAVNFVESLKESTQVYILSKCKPIEGKPLKYYIELLGSQGFSRLLIDGTITKIENLLEENTTNLPADAMVLVDRLVVSKDSLADNRIADSVTIAYNEGQGECFIDIVENGKSIKRQAFNNRFEKDGISFEEPTPAFFSFNNAYGACKTCEGHGTVLGVDENLVIPDKSLSIYDNAIACWRGEVLGNWREELIEKSSSLGIPIHRPYEELSDDQKEIIWKGKGNFPGIKGFFKFVEEQLYKIQYRVLLSRYRGITTCPDCKGTRIRKDADYVKINGLSIIDIVRMPISDILNFFENLNFSEFEKQLSSRIMPELLNRLRVMEKVGLGYLSLGRGTATLSGGEHQRMSLSRALGSSLVGSMYILDEPSIGLHPHDTHNLIAVLKQLRDLGNTVIVVEHDEEIIRAADYLIDLGPGAGIHGGNVVYQGYLKDLKPDTAGYTASYLSGKLEIPLPKFRRKPKGQILVKSARENNLKNIDVEFPLNVLTVVTGLSGSGKTSLVRYVLYAGMKRHFGEPVTKIGEFKELQGSLNSIESVEFVDQNPIGRSSRSNPVTYVKAFDEIRELFASQKLAKVRGYKPGFFSFNVPGGRCDTCEGEGIIKVEMQFMADLYLVCESCNGKRYKDDVLEVTYNGKNIFDVLDMSVEEAIDFFTVDQDKLTESRICRNLLPLKQVGLGYIKLGQSSNTLSGGEAQRVKLAAYIAKGNSANKKMLIFDEPTTGLHFHDIQNLLNSFNMLLDAGHTVVVIEHNPDVIKCADWIIDLGPGSGDAGGYLMFSGCTDDIAECNESITAKFLSAKLKQPGH